jgi:hypothetical protein
VGEDGDDDESLFPVLGELEEANMDMNVLHTVDGVS